LRGVRRLWALTGQRLLTKNCMGGQLDLEKTKDFRYYTTLQLLDCRSGAWTRVAMILTSVKLGRQHANMRRLPWHKG
jgi:hypothetical protein